MTEEDMQEQDVVQPDENEEDETSRVETTQKGKVVMFSARVTPDVGPGAGVTGVNGYLLRAALQASKEDPAFKEQLQQALNKMDVSENV